MSSAHSRTTVRSLDACGELAARASTSASEAANNRVKCASSTPFAVRPKPTLSSDKSHCGYSPPSFSEKPTICAACSCASLSPALYQAT